MESDGGGATPRGFGVSTDPAIIAKDSAIVGKLAAWSYLFAPIGADHIGHPLTGCIAAENSRIIFVSMIAKDNLVTCAARKSKDWSLVNAAHTFARNVKR